MRYLLLSIMLLADLAHADTLFHVNLGIQGQYFSQRQSGLNIRVGSQVLSERIAHGFGGKLLAGLDITPACLITGRLTLECAWEIADCKTRRKKTTTWAGRF